jgi:hypothetical protein
MGCGCKRDQAAASTPTVQKTMISEEISVKGNELHVLQKFSDGTHQKKIVKSRPVGARRKIGV